MNPQDVALAVKRLEHRLHRALDAALARLGISQVQWDALRHIGRHPGSSLHDLATLTFQTDQAFGALAGRLVRRRLVRRTPGPGRALHHTLTPAGADLLRRGNEIVDDVFTESFGPLSEAELTTFHALLTRLLAEETRRAPAASGPVVWLMS